MIRVARPQDREGREAGGGGGALPGEWRGAAHTGHTQPECHHLSVRCHPSVFADPDEAHHQTSAWPLQSEPIRNRAWTRPRASPLLGLSLGRLHGKKTGRSPSGISFTQRLDDWVSSLGPALHLAKGGPRAGEPFRRKRAAGAGENIWGTSGETARQEQSHKGHHMARSKRTQGQANLGAGAGRPLWGDNTTLRKVRTFQRQGQHEQRPCGACVVGGDHYGQGMRWG